jgi:hypothetical protein
MRRYVAGHLRGPESCCHGKHSVEPPSGLSRANVLPHVSVALATLLRAPSRRPSYADWVRSRDGAYRWTVCVDLPICRRPCQTHGNAATSRAPVLSRDPTRSVWRSCGRWQSNGWILICIPGEDPSRHALVRRRPVRPAAWKEMLVQSRHYGREGLHARRRRLAEQSNFVGRLARLPLNLFFRSTR